MNYIVKDHSENARPLSMQSTDSRYLKETVQLEGTFSFDVFHNPKKEMTYFIEKNPIKVSKHYLVYTFSHKTGNLTFGHAGKWARSEINSNSFAFHKGDANKMPLSDDREVVLERIQSHYANYTPGAVRTHCR